MADRITVRVNGEIVPHTIDGNTVYFDDSITLNDGDTLSMEMYYVDDDELSDKDIARE